MAKTKTILAIDDELSIRESFNLILSDHYKLEMAASGEAALKKITDQKIDLVFLDIRMPGIDGLESLRKILEIDPNIKVIMVTAVNDVQKASEAIRIGAYDYIIKPFDVEQILNLTKQALASQERNKETAYLKIKSEEHDDDLIGRSENIRQIENKIKDFKFDKPAIIIGAAGTEKTAIIKKLHYLSPHRSGPIHRVDLAKPLSLTEAQKLFLGKVSGESIFSLSSEKGALETAGNGTLVINNFENLPEEFLKQLLHIFLHQTFAKIDSFVTFPVDFGLMLTSSLDYPQLLTATGDLDWGIVMELSKLFDRPTDIATLLEYYMEKYKNFYYRNTKGFTKEAHDILINYTWPGNAEEIESLVIELLSRSHQEWINPKDLPIKILTSSYLYSLSHEDKKINFYSLEQDFEKAWIKKALEFTKQDKAQAAKLLKITSTILSAKI